MTGQPPTCAVCDRRAGAPTAPLRRPAYRDGEYLCAGHAGAPERHLPGAVERYDEQLDAEAAERELRRRPPQHRAAGAAPAQTTAPPGPLPQGPAVQPLPRSRASTRPRQGENPLKAAPQQGTERPLAPTQGTRAALPPHVPSPSHAAPPAPPAAPAPPPDPAAPPLVEAPPQLAPRPDEPPPPSPLPPADDQTVIG